MNDSTGVMPSDQTDLDPAAPSGNWLPPRRTLIVATTPRCGSTWLGGLVGSTGHLGRPSEWFREPTLRSREQVLEGLGTVRTKGMTANGIAGVKLFPYYLEPILRHVRLSRWLPDAVWVHMVRRDLLGQAISLWRAHETDIWHVEAFAPSGAAAGDRPTPPAYDATAIALCLTQLVALEADWRAFFARTGIRPLKVVYEDALEDPDGTVRRLAAALDVSLPPTPFGAASKFAVQRDDTTRAIRERFLAERGDPDGPFRQLLPPERLKQGRPDRVAVPRTIGNVVRLLRGRSLKGV